MPGGLSPVREIKNLRQEIERDRIGKRIVLYFPGFEPLDAQAHHSRYARSAEQSSNTWDLELDLGHLHKAKSSSYFDVNCRGNSWLTETRIHIFDHKQLVSQLTHRPLPQRLWLGYLSAFRVICQGAAMSYFRCAWRFALFFMFPFVLIAFGMGIALAIAALPYFLTLSMWSYIVSVPSAIMFFGKLFIPMSDRFYAMHLLADWELAVTLGHLDQHRLSEWLEVCEEGVRTALREPADEYVIASHSMGSTMAVHVLGSLLKEEPEILAGKKLVFLTLGGAILQSALLRSAVALRASVGTIAKAKEVTWLEIQCHTDPIHFYRSQVVALSGHLDAPQAEIAFIRIRNMLFEKRYDKIKRNFLRVHRQYVMGSDKRSGFDFTLITAGPLPASSFAHYSQTNLPII